MLASGIALTGSKIFISEEQKKKKQRGASKLWGPKPSTVERVNSDLKDNYGTRYVRVKGHWKVLGHLMFCVIAITVKQLFNMLE